METFKREDYVYLKFIEDYEDESGDKYESGRILRYRKEWLIENIAGRQFKYVFGYNNELIYEKNDDCDENDILYHKIYKSIIVSKDINYGLYLWSGDYFYLNDWLFEHIDREGIDTIIKARKRAISDQTNSPKLIELAENHSYGELVARINFKKGEKIDFSNPAVIALFYNPEWMKLLAKTVVISGKEKQELFDEDFSNAICAQSPVDAIVYENEPNRYLQEYHFFKLKDDIRIKTRDELRKRIGIEIPNGIDFICDDEGVIKYAFQDIYYKDSSDRDIEQFILKFANRVSVDEAYECHKKLVADYIKKRELQRAKWEREEEEERIKLQKLYESEKNNPSYFPGVNGYFVHNDNKNQEREKYTLLQIKEFYRKLKTLDPNIVQEMCFYGGTIPYILNNASESRDFGDIDIFVPVAQMEKLRDELARQDSFEMICDSKPLAQFCNLTSRIQKESKELVSENEQTNEFLGLMLSAMTTPQGEDIINVDHNGNVYDPFEEFFSRTRTYYNKTQDFGFKAKLFGINISVFPIYQYENDIMAKSFNISEMYRFLLGVRVLNNANLDDFVKNVEIYDSVFKVLPLEYTLVSKKSAVDKQYSCRLEKDREDIEYILAHKEELGIDDEKIQEILSKYPDYSISIAYKVNDDRTTSTMGGATYKELVLTNRNVS